MSGYNNEDENSLNSNPDANTGASWIPDEALNNLVTEREVHPNESEEQLARRLLRENLPTVVLGIVHTAVHGSNERTRLDAQKYVVERVLGRVGDDAFGAERSPIEQFVSEVTEFVEAAAKGSSSNE